MEISLGSLPIRLPQSLALDGAICVVGIVCHESGPAAFCGIRAFPGGIFFLLRGSVAELLVAYPPRMEAPGLAVLLLHAECSCAGGHGGAVSWTKVRNLADCEGPPMKIEFL